MAIDYCQGGVGKPSLETVRGKGSIEDIDMPLVGRVRLIDQDANPGCISPNNVRDDDAPTDWRPGVTVPMPAPVKPDPRRSF